MSTFTDYQRSLCLEALDNVLKYSISKMFAAPVDPEKDGCPDYLEKITKPMDLGTARNKLINNEYNSLEEFKNDISLIWENTVTYHSKYAIISYLAQQLDEVFKKEIKCVLPDDNQSWLAKYAEIKQETGEFKAIIDPNSSKQTNSRSSSSSSRSKSSTANTTSNTTQASSTRSTRSSSRNAHAQPKEENQDPSLTEKEINAISDDAALISTKGTAEQIQRLINYISEQEPYFVKDGGVDIEIAKLKTSTMIGLRKIIDEMLPELPQ